MSQGEWVLLPVMLGMLGLLSFASRVDSASLSVPNSANEISRSRVCAGLCDADLAGKTCRVFCTSRRQSRIQSNTVTGQGDVVDVEDTRRGACPTLCQHAFRLPTCNCDKPRVSWENLCDFFCEDDSRSSGCPECLKTQAARRKETMENIRASIGPGRSSRSLMDASVPRGTLAESYVTGEEEVEEDARTTEGLAANADGNNVDWEEFCRIECSRGNGGLACNCDIIP